MPAPLSYALRRQIYEASCWDTAASVAARFGVSIPTIYRLRRLVRTSGFIEPKPRGGGRRRHLTDDDRPRFEAYLADTPEASSSELAARFSSDTGQPVSRQTVQAQLTRWGLARRQRASPVLLTRPQAPNAAPEPHPQRSEHVSGAEGPAGRGWHTLRIRLPELADASWPGSDEAGPRLLIVEDQPDMQKLTAAFIDRSFPLVLAANATEALGAARTMERFGVVLLDIHLGDGPSGLDVLPLLRACRACEHATFVAMTAYARHGDEERMIEAGFDRFIAKPFTRAQLREALTVSVL